MITLKFQVQTWLGRKKFSYCFLIRMALVSVVFIWWFNMPKDQEQWANPQPPNNHETCNLMQVGAALQLAVIRLLLQQCIAVTTFPWYKPYQMFNIIIGFEDILYKDRITSMLYNMLPQRQSQKMADLLKFNINFPFSDQH